MARLHIPDYCAALNHIGFWSAPILYLDFRLGFLAAKARKKFISGTGHCFWICVLKCLKTLGNSDGVELANFLPFQLYGDSFEKWHNRLAAINSGQKMAVLWGISPLGGNDKGAGMVCVCKPELLLLTWVRSPWFDTDTPIHAHTNTITPTISGTQQTNRKNLSTFSFKILHIKHFCQNVDWARALPRGDIFWKSISRWPRQFQRDPREGRFCIPRPERSSGGNIFL